MIRRGGEVAAGRTPRSRWAKKPNRATTAVIRDVGEVAAPLDLSGVDAAAGSTARVDVVVRTRKIGHFFPGGTVDAFDVWLELQARDDATAN